MSDCAPRLGAVAGAYEKPRRHINKVFIHCSAVSNPRTNASEVDAWHRARGWSCIGYHYFIPTYGGALCGRDLELTPAAQVGHNTGTIAICLNGLVETDFTSDQFKALRGLCGQIWEAHAKQVTFHGHREVAAKACPVFDYRTVLNLDAAGRIRPGPARYTPPPAPPKPPTTMTPRSDLPPEEPDVTLQVVRPMVEFGSEGRAVKRLQGLLLAFSPVGPGVVDGDFGAWTAGSLKEFQELHGLTPDGICGPLTWETLERL